MVLLISRGHICPESVRDTKIEAVVSYAAQNRKGPRIILILLFSNFLMVPPIDLTQQKLAGPAMWGLRLSCSGPCLREQSTEGLRNESEDKQAQQPAQSLNIILSWFVQGFQLFSNYIQNQIC